MPAAAHAPVFALPIVWLWLFAFGEPALAESRPPERAPLGLQEALDQALGHNKDLAAFEHSTAEGLGQLEQAGLLPNPQLELVLEDAIGSGDFSSFDSAQTTLSIGWVLEGRVRRGRIRAAEANVEVLGARARLLRVRVAAETAEHFLAGLTSQERLERALDAIALSEEAVAVVSRRVDAGKTPAAELARAEAKLAADRLARDDVTHELKTAYRRLAAQWGDSQPRFSQVAGDLLKLPSVEPYSVLAGSIEGNPTLARYATEERLANANLRLAEARSRPLVRPQIGIRRLEATDDTAFIAGFSIPVAVRNRNQGEIAKSRASVSRVRAEADSVRLRMETTLFELYEELQHHFHQTETLQVAVIPLLTEALKGTRRAYESGRSGYSELRSVQGELLQARNELIDASAGAHRLVIALERLLGRQVVRP